jgi:hypothetical protein
MLLTFSNYSPRRGKTHTSRKQVRVGQERVSDQTQGGTYKENKQGEHNTRNKRNKNGTTTTTNNNNNTKHT